MLSIFHLMFFSHKTIDLNDILQNVFQKQTFSFIYNFHFLILSFLILYYCCDSFVFPISLIKI